MKKDKKILISFVSIIFAYALCLLLFTLFLPNSLFVKLWFTNFLIFLSIFLFIKSWFYIADSTMFLAMEFLLIGISNYLVYFLFLSESLRYSLFLLATSISFLAVFVKFKNLFYLSASLCAFLLSIPLFLWAFSCINLLTLILLSCLILALEIVFLIVKKKV